MFSGIKEFKKTNDGHSVKFFHHILDMKTTDLNTTYSLSMHTAFSC